MFMSINMDPQFDEFGKGAGLASLVKSRNTNSRYDLASCHADRAGACVKL